MDYKKMMGYSNKKKTSTKKSKKNKIIENIKLELNEWNDTSFKNLPKRWSNSQGLTEHEQELKEGPSYEYKETFKDIEKDLQNFSAGVLTFWEYLKKKGLKKEANHLLNNVYKKHVIGFHKEFKKFARKLM